METSLFIAIVIFFGFILMFSSKRSRRVRPFYPLPRPNGESEDEPDVSFTELFDIMIDTRSQEYYSDLRRKEELDFLHKEIRRAGVEVAIADQMNKLDAKINEMKALQIGYDEKNQRAILEVMREKQAVLEEGLKVKTGEAQNEIKRQLLEVQQAQFQHQQNMLYDHIERELWKVSVKAQELEIAKYFFQKYQTLELDKINFIHKRNKLDLQRDKDNITNLLAKLDVRDAKTKLREDVSNLVVRENRLTLRSDEYDFLQRRAVKHLKFESLESYMKAWHHVDQMSREYGYTGVENCIHDLLAGGQLASFLETERELAQLKQRFKELPAGNSKDSK